MSEENEMEATSLSRRPTWQVVAGRIARFFGIQFYDLYYGEKGLLSLHEPVAPSFSREVRLSTVEDLNGIIHRMGGKARRVFDHNTAVNSTCYVALHEGTIAGYLWVNRQIMDLTGMYVARLPANFSFVHNVFIFPEHRRENNFQCLFRAVCKEMQRAGFLSVTCFVDKTNSPAVEAFRREGTKFHNAAVIKFPWINPVLFCRALA